MSEECDLLVDRITPEDHLVFSKLRVWSAAPQVKAHQTDCKIFNSLVIMRSVGVKTTWVGASISIVANGGEMI